MKQSEVVYQLERIRKTYLQIEQENAINEAIRCVELLPELVDALELTNKMMFGLDSNNEYIEVFYTNQELLKKAKGLME